MAMLSGARGVPRAEMNVTSLIDVLLVLLIIFMVILPSRSNGEPAEIPQPGKQATTPLSSTIVVELHASKLGSRPNLSINQQLVNWSELETRLRNIYSSRAEKIAFLQGDDEIDFQYVAEALDMIHQVGVERVGLLGNNR